MHLTGQHPRPRECHDQARVTAAPVIWTGSGQTPGPSATNSTSPAR
jgi:hypothetical protein